MRNWDNYIIGFAPIAVDNKTNNNNIDNKDANNKDLRGPPNDNLDKLYGVYN